ncbi:MAG: TolC family protein [Saprospiraceae bacterium]
MKSKFLLFLPLLFAGLLRAGDTLQISLAQADSMFLRNNYRLLAAALDVKAQSAQMIQARLYPNPEFSIDFNAVDPQNERVFHVGESGEKALEINQLILLGGKRRAQIDLARSNVAIAELTLEDLVRELRFQLHKSYFALDRQRFLIDRYTRQMTLLQSLIDAYDEQSQKGNVALKDLARLKSEYLDLLNTRAQLYQEHFAEQTTLQTLLRTSAYILPAPLSLSYERYTQQNFQDSTLLNLALAGRPDILLARQNETLAAQNTRYQQSLARPDLTLSASYDQRGGAFNHQINLGASLPLPLWNRNQGNIQTAKIGESIARNNSDALLNNISVEIANANRAYQQTLAEYNTMLRTFDQDYEVVLKGMSDNFRRGNINLIEFLDFFQAYNDALDTVSGARQQLATAGETLNYLTAKELFQK